jgi:hypothetical protein
MPLLLCAHHTCYMEHMGVSPDLLREKQAINRLTYCMYMSTVKLRISETLMEKSRQRRQRRVI